METITQKIAESMIISGHVRATIRDAKTWRIKRVYEYHNLNPTAGRQMLWQQIDPTLFSASNVLSHVAVGSGTTAPAEGDTQLETETYRDAIASSNIDGKALYVTGFFDTSEANGTIREAAVLIGGTSSANTGSLLSHVALNVTKTSSETLTLDWTLNLNI